MSVSGGGFPKPGTGEADRMLAEARRAFWVMVGFLAIIWIIQLINVADSYHLTFDYGFKSRDLSTLPEILSAPFLHFNWMHIEGNSGPLFVFGFLAAYQGVRKFLGLSLLVIIVSGLGAWFTSPANDTTAGASGLIFGYFGYILVRGIFDRHLINFVIGLVMGLCFAYQFSDFVPQDGISWQGHVFGFVGGILGGWLFRERRAKQPRTPAAVDPAAGLTGLDPTTFLAKPDPAPKDTTS